VNDAIFLKLNVTVSVVKCRIFVPETNYKPIKKNQMKKISLLAASVIVIALSTTSCKKDYRCECSKTYTSGTGSYTKDYSVYTYKENRNRAEDRCNENTKSSSDILGNYSINCQIQ